MGDLLHLHRRRGRRDHHHRGPVASQRRIRQSAGRGLIAEAERALIWFDTDPEVHRVLMEKVFPKQALVTETDKWIQSL